MYKKYFKRPFDIIMSSVALIVLSPLLFVIAILVRIKLGSPVLFKQKRPGKNEKIFTIYKFRTMTNKKDQDGNLLSDKERLTRFGSFLRSTSLDELPALLNIIKGEMSIVGPRPLLVQYLPLYNRIQKKRHDVRPGLTGVAQINGRNNLSWDEKFKLDVRYIKNISLLKDIKIILITLLLVIRQKDINQDNKATVDFFKGND